MCSSTKPPLCGSQSYHDKLVWPLGRWRLRTPGVPPPGCPWRCLVLTMSALEMANSRLGRHQLANTSLLGPCPVPGRGGQTRCCPVARAHGQETQWPLQAPSPRAHSLGEVELAIGLASVTALLGCQPHHALISADLVLTLACRSCVLQGSWDCRKCLSAPLSLQTSEPWAQFALSLSVSPWASGSWLSP